MSTQKEVDEAIAAVGAPADDRIEPPRTVEESTQEAVEAALASLEPQAGD